jgi:hypothetical protein
MLKAIIETTKIKFNLLDMQVTEIAIQARVKRMHQKENKKNYAFHKSAILTPEKPQRIKEMPCFVDPKTEAEHTFNMVVNRPSYLMNGTIIWSNEKSSTFLPASTTAMGPKGQISLMRESLNYLIMNTASRNQRRSSTGSVTPIIAFNQHCNSSMWPALQSRRDCLG